MSTKPTYEFDPKRDLVFERSVDVPRELVWKAWTEPEHLMKWFCPRPWRTTECEIDLRPGGKFYTKMCGPEGEEFGNAGCYLEVVENEKLVFTDALGPGYRPSEKPFFTAIVLMEPNGKGTKYTAYAIHGDEAGRKQHEEMGFHEGWGKAWEQLVELVKSW